MLDSSVGYIGGANPLPTYNSVCAGDGHTEALRLEFDPGVISYEELVREFLEDPHVRDVFEPEDEGAQYRTAIWSQNPSQVAIAQRMVEEVGKDVPIMPRAAWHEAEGYHQHFLAPSLARSSIQGW